MIVPMPSRGDARPDDARASKDRVPTPERGNHRRVELSSDLEVSSRVLLGVNTLIVAFQPVDAVHLADDHEIVTVGTDRAVVVEFIA